MIVQRKKDREGNNGKREKCWPTLFIIIKIINYFTKCIVSNKFNF